MDALRKIFRFGTDNGLPSIQKKTQEANEFGFYTGEQKRASFTKENWTCENESYRFPISESPKDPWERCFEVVDRADEELYKELKDEISWLLIVASLFMGIITAFSIMSFGWLREDERQVSAKLLGDIVKLLNDTNTRGTVPPRDVTTSTFVPRDSDIIINQMWFVSMTLSLSAVVVGTLCLQWLSTFRRKETKQRSYDDALALRQLRFEGLIGWGVPHIPGFLLLAVQGALVLFAAGLMYLLWSVNKRVAVPVVVVGGATTLLLIITAVMPLLQSVTGWIFPSTLVIPQCPYKSPLSWILHRGCVLLSTLVTLPFCLFPWFKWISEWRVQQIELLTDYTWQVFDDLWRDQREHRGPQTSKTGSIKYSYYLVRGLASAMEKLVFQPNAVHIIHSCLQDFYGTTAEKETFQGLFGEASDVVKLALIEYSALSSTFGHMFDNTAERHLSTSHKKNLRRDFLNAHALQHFVSHNPKLHPALLPHRVELFIRIKNSSRYFDIRSLGRVGNLDPYSYAETRYIGSSTKCPIQSIRDAETLSSELRHQYLEFAKWYLDSDRCEESDAEAIKFVLGASQKLRTVPDVEADDANEPSLEDRMKSVFKSLDEYLSDKSRHLRQSSSTSGGGNCAPPDQGHRGPAGVQTGNIDGIAVEDRIQRAFKSPKEHLTEKSDRELLFSILSEGEIGAPLNQGYKDPAGSDAPADKGSSADFTDLYEVVRVKLEKYEQRMEAKAKKSVKPQDVHPTKRHKNVLPC